MQITKEEIKRVVSNVQNYTLAKKYLKAADIESMVVLCCLLYTSQVVRQSWYLALVYVMVLPWGILE